MIFLQQAGRNKHAHICESLELFAAEVMGEFKAGVAEREAKKAAELAPYIAAAMARKVWMPALADHEIPVVPASRKTAEINAVATRLATREPVVTTLSPADMIREERDAR